MEHQYHYIFMCQNSHLGIAYTLLMALNLHIYYGGLLQINSGGVLQICGGLLQICDACGGLQQINSGGVLQICLVFF
ncbi:hypothetical protein LOK49_LG04G00265 [Camellia lanceoleosa]|uniref:Uncharacterized protein n=1 Tax=Camellia lanceoleosa TaxID=1840588 RepID=A0ACC0HV96_9ERIC|nr:hypothetical protein LOK49_LG04G00265 [Camellia lanceoleosa]